MRGYSQLKLFSIARHQNECFSNSALPTCIWHLHNVSSEFWCWQWQSKQQKWGQKESRSQWWRLDHFLVCDYDRCCHFFISDSLLHLCSFSSCCNVFNLYRDRLWWMIDSFKHLLSTRADCLRQRRHLGEPPGLCLRAQDCWFDARVDRVKTLPRGTGAIDSRWASVWCLPLSR